MTPGTAYRDNQARAQKAWLDRHPDYWNQYRHRHPEYVDRSREDQAARNAYRKADDVIAEMDVRRPPPRDLLVPKDSRRSSEPAHVNNFPSTRLMYLLV